MVNNGNNIRAVKIIIVPLRSDNNSNYFAQTF